MKTVAEGVRTTVKEGDSVVLTLKGKNGKGKGLTVNGQIERISWWLGTVWFRIRGKDFRIDAAATNIFSIEEIKKEKKAKPKKIKIKKIVEVSK